MLLLLTGCMASKEVGTGKQIVVVYQPSHQTDTGRDFSEAAVCNSIVEAAIAASTGVVKVYKVWSHDVEGVHHAQQGSNTKIEHTSALDSLSRISGYAYELQESNKLRPDVFIAVHNNGATKSHACWGFIHEGDSQEGKNRELAKELVDELCRVTGLTNRGIHFDSSTGRNDYRCRVSGSRAFYSLDENINYAPIRVLLEIGDNETSRDFLMNQDNQKKMGEVIQRVLEQKFGAQ